jgi:hypothetical protein
MERDDDVLFQYTSRHLPRESNGNYADSQNSALRRFG